MVHTGGFQLEPFKYFILEIVELKLSNYNLLIYKQFVIYNIIYIGVLNAN